LIIDDKPKTEYHANNNILIKKVSSGNLFNETKRRDSMKSSILKAENKKKQEKYSLEKLTEIYMNNYDNYSKSLSSKFLKRNSLKKDILKKGGRIESPKKTNKGESILSFSDEKFFLPPLKVEDSSNFTQSNITNTTRVKSQNPLSKSTSIYDTFRQDNRETTENKPKNKKMESIQGNLKLSKIPQLLNNMIKDQNSNTQSKHKNIINIVNNFDRTNEKKIAFKVNVNQYDIKYYVPSKQEETQSDLSDETEANMKDMNIHKKNLKKFLQINKPKNLEIFSEKSEGISK
jgi:hypothetical protein